MPSRPAPNWAKLGGILGLIAAEIYLFFTVASPRLAGVEIPISALASRLLALAPFFGGFGLAFGTGLGLLAGSLLSKAIPEKPTQPGQDSQPPPSPHPPKDASS